MSDAPAAVRPATPKAAPLDPLGVFTVLWAGQGLVQLATYVDFERDLAWWALALTSVSTVLRPRSTSLLATMLVLNVGYSWLHLPYVVNHLLFEDALNLLLLGALVVSWRAGNGDLRRETTRAFAGPARAAVIVMYGWAAFAKLNTDYFSPAVSCTSEMLTDALHVDLSGTVLSTLSISAAAVSAAMEGVLALSLAFRRSRRVAIPVGLAFHLGLALVPYAAVQAFSYIMFAAYFLFTSDEFGQSAVEVGSNVANTIRVRWRVLLLITGAVVGVGSAVSVGYAVLWTPRDAIELVVNTGCFLGLVAAFVAYIACARRTGRAKVATDRALLGGAPVLQVVPVGLLLLGTLPYAGFGTRASFTMFSNLRTEDGRSNHLLVPSDIQVANYQDDLVRVISSDEPTLLARRDEGNLITRFEFERTLHEADDFEVLCECYGSTLHITKRDGEVHGFDQERSFSPVLGRLMSFRPISDGETMGCLH